VKNVPREQKAFTRAKGRFSLLGESPLCVSPADKFSTSDKFLEKWRKSTILSERAREFRVNFSRWSLSATFDIAAHRAAVTRAATIDVNRITREID